MENNLESQDHMKVDTSIDSESENSNIKNPNINNFIIVFLIILIVGVIAVIVSALFKSNPSKANLLSNEKLTLPPPVGRTKEVVSNPVNNINTAKTVVRDDGRKVTPTQSADSISTLDTPVKIKTFDNKQYFLYGAPIGQNNKKVKKIIFSLPGHGSTAESDYDAWKKQLLLSGSYALASLNWWDGKGEAPQNYLSPEQIIKEIKSFLMTNGYTNSDFVVLEGFSRGSANTYSTKGYDAISGSPVIDAVISASGKYQSDFAMTDEILKFNNGKVYSGTYWILACGEKDENPDRDGCRGMRETETFLHNSGALILAFLSDPNGGHGAFHMSSLNLALKALETLDQNIK